MSHIRRFCSLGLCLLLTSQAVPQSSSTSSAAAGVAAGAALAAGAGQGSTSASSAGGANSPIEMNIMVYGGIKQIALKIASDVDTVLPPTSGSAADWKVPDASPSDKPCATKASRKILLEDSTSAPQIALYKTFGVYQQNILNLLTPMQSRVTDDWNQIKAIVKRENDAAQAEAEAAKKAAEEQKKKEEAQKRAPQAQKFEFTLPPGVTNMQISTQGSSGVATSSAPVTGSTAGATAPATGGGGAATAPVSLTYLSDISAAVGAAKNGITYASSSIQPTTQALTTELAKDLCNRGIELYNSTSSVNPPDPNEVVTDISTLSAIIADIQSRVYVNVPGDPKDKSQLQSLVSDISSLATAANQLMTTFQTWLLSSDGNGNIILTDVIRGYTLNYYIGKGIPALQFTIDAAGGNTRTNSFFLLNLFYTPKPSFNGGVVVTYELRDKENTYIAGETLKVLYDYSKWKPKSFAMSGGIDGTSLGTGR